MDEREGQVLRDFDCFFNEIVEGCNKFNIEKPAMFLKEPDHTCLTYYHKNKDKEGEKLQEKEEKRKLAASNLIMHLVQSNKLSCLVHKKGGTEGKKIYKGSV